MFHLGLRGREFQCKLRKNDIELFMHKGKEYCQLTLEFSTKNHQGGVNSHASAIPAGIICDKGDIFSIKFLLQKLNSDSDRLFQRPKVKYSAKDAVWLTAQALGKNTLASMMKNISKQAKCSKPYTNHSVRATTITASEPQQSQRQSYNSHSATCSWSLRPPDNVYYRSSQLSKSSDLPTSKHGSKNSHGVNFGRQIIGRGLT